jgi:hypothetical protein
MRSVTGLALPQCVGVAAVGKWSAANKKRALMTRRGFRNSRQQTPFMAPLLRAPRPIMVGPSKADLRQQADAALAQWQQKQKGV